MDDLDLDSFIANIELTAPEDTQGARFACNECGGHLVEDDDGNFTCPICSVQATNILQLDDTELHHDDQGRPVYGQRVRLTERKSRHTVDYGWSWSTDDAIFLVLNLQLEALERANLLPDSFIEATMIMWQRYWLDAVAPHIKDDYSDNDLVPISVSRALKLRDVEVLVKVKDKVMIPLHLVKNKSDAKIIYRMLGTQFFVSKTNYDGDRDQPDNSDSEPFEDGHLESYESDNSLSDDCEFDDALVDEPDDDKDRHQQGVDGDLVLVDDLTDIAQHCRNQTKNISIDSITVLTLNRTLAFLEATARGLHQKDPLFAADIIRACNQRLIPFYGASRLMPENMKFDQRDKLGFQKMRPPTPRQLSRAALLILSTTHREQLPKKLPAPDLATILERFTKDLNLPRALFESMRDKASFHNFRRTRPRIITKSQSGYLPQYDRWAFAVLVIHLKILFNLGDGHVIAQKEKALRVSRDGKGGDYFILHDWLRQLSLRLDLILRHDPFVLYHPLADIERMEPTPQLAKYLEQIVEDTAQADVTLHGNDLLYDVEGRNELADLLRRELRPPLEIERDLSLQDEELRVSKEIKYPLSDSIRRTQQFWAHKLDLSTRDLALKSFTTKELVLLDDLPQWSIYDCGLTLKSRQLEISPKWPGALVLLLHAGAFLCFCEPVDLLDELKSIEEEYHPQVKIVKRINYARKRSMLARAGYNAPGTSRN